MSSRKQQINNIVGDFVDAIDKYADDANLLDADDAFKDVIENIHAMSSVDQRKLILIEAQVQQWRGLINADYATQLFHDGTQNENISYSTIKKYIKHSLDLFKSSKHKITKFEEKANNLDYIFNDDIHGGILIDFCNFRIKCIDFYVLQYNLFQNYGSILVSTLPSIAIDIYPDMYSKLKLGIQYLLKALQILHDFSAMLADKQPTNPCNKICKQNYRIPRTFFGDHSGVSALDVSGNDQGFKQYLLDCKCKTYFELSKAYVAISDFDSADDKYNEGIGEIINGSNHGKYIQSKPPDSWFQLIQSCIRYFIKYKRINQHPDKSNKAHRVIRHVLAFYAKHDIDSIFVTNILLERARLLMFDGDFAAAVRTNELVKSNHFAFEKQEIRDANHNENIIQCILRKKNDLKDSIHYFKMDGEDEWRNFYQWIKAINCKVMKEIYYNKYWSINNEHDANGCAPPIEMVDDIIEFILDCLGVEAKLKNINILALLRLIEKWNCGNDNLYADLTHLSAAVAKMNKCDAEILIDFLHFGAMSYLHRIPAKIISGCQVMAKIAALAKYAKCEERESLLYFKLGECYKARKIYAKANEYLERAAGCAEKIGNIEIVRNARITQVEIFDIQNDDTAKEEIIELHLTKKYKINKVLKYMDEYGGSCEIECKYENGNDRNMDIVIPVNGDCESKDCDIVLSSSDDDDDYTITNTKAATTKQPKTKRKAVTKKGRFEESDDEDVGDNRSLNDSNNTIYSLRSLNDLNNSNSRKRKADSAFQPLYNNNNNKNRHKRQKLNNNDNYSDCTDLQCNNGPILDLASDSEEEEEDEKEIDFSIESESQELDILVLDDVHMYYHESLDEVIKDEKEKIKRLVVYIADNPSNNNIKSIIKICKSKILIADSEMDKATFIKNNEPKGRNTNTMIRQCHKNAVEYCREVSSDGKQFINKYLIKCRREQVRNINKQHSMLMFYYFASLEYYGKYLISKRKWDEAIQEYDAYLKHELVSYQTVHQSVVLHWRYYCTSNIAHSYRQRGSYEDRLRSKDHYKQSLDILNNLLKQKNTNNKYKYILDKTLSATNINEQRAYSKIELGHTYDELNQCDRAKMCYSEAAGIANKYDLIDKELDAYFNLALTLYHLKDFDRCLRVFQTKCRQCVQLCIAQSPIYLIEYRKQQFEIERWITDIFLRKKQMQNATSCARKMNQIATKWLYKHKKYKDEAMKYDKDCRRKTKVKSRLYERLQTIKKQSNAEIYQELKDHYVLRSYGTIIEEKEKYFKLKEKIMNIYESLHISFLLGTAFREKEKYYYAQTTFVAVLSNKKYINSNANKAKIKWLPKIALACFEVMAYNNTKPNDRIKILLSGAKYINNQNRKEIDWNIRYYQTAILHYQYFQSQINQENNSRIPQIQRQLKCLQEQHPNNNGRRNNYTKQANAVQRSSRYRFNQHKNSYRRRKNNIYAHPANANTNASNQGSAFGIVSRHQQKRKQAALGNQYNNNSNNPSLYRGHSRSAQQALRTQTAKNLAGLPENASQTSLEVAIADINRILDNNPTYIVMTDLKNLKDLYENYLSKAKQKSNSTQNQIARNLHSIINIETINIRNNTIGIIHEAFEWIYFMNDRDGGTPFGSNEAKAIEQSYRNKNKVYHNYGSGHYDIRFNKLGLYKKKIRLHDRNGFRVQRRISLTPLHRQKMRGWSSFWMSSGGNCKRYQLDKQRHKMEYNAICELMKNRGMSGGLEIHRIERIQNIDNQQRYNNCLNGIDNQLLLFHGTRPLNVSGIISEGTDFRLHGDNGTKYGNGSYFAVYASYAAQFCKQSQVDAIIGRMVKYMFLCAVKAGSFCKGSSGLRRPPKIMPNNNDSKLYDSVVDHVDKPSMFVTFDNAQSLPLYLITFTFDETP